MQGFYFEANLKKAPDEKLEDVSVKVQTLLQKKLSMDSTATLESTVKNLALLRFCMPQVAEMCYRTECLQRGEETKKKHYIRITAVFRSLCDVADGATRVRVLMRAFFMKTFARKFSIGALEKLVAGKFTWILPEDFRLKEKVV